tara:strand:- start:227 stop:367 length:141 start_codon:yes stop_codon:yes gene_type:complete
MQVRLTKATLEVTEPVVRLTLVVAVEEPVALDKMRTQTEEEMVVSG